jgi:hypothetical protein
VKLPLFQVDAFTDRVFSGNPAAVCPLESWLDEQEMLSIAAENNLSETAFCVPEDGAYRLRWFTLKSEVQLCGHATLATAFVIFNVVRPKSQICSLSNLQRPAGSPAGRRLPGDGLSFIACKALRGSSTCASRRLGPGAAGGAGDRPTRPLSETISSCAKPKTTYATPSPTWRSWQNCIPPEFVSPRPANSQTSCRATSPRVMEFLKIP